MVEPEVGPLAAELAAHGTDPSPLEAVLEALPERIPDAEPLLVAEAPLPPDEERDLSDVPVGTGALDALGEEAGPEPQPPWTTPSEETFYDALGVAPQASREQIEKAHRFCLEMYKEGALATYSLLEPGDAEAARRRIHLAFETLCDPERRREYDLSLGLTPTAATALPVALAERSFSNQATSSSGEPVLPAGQILGADLRKLRESRGISLREIAVSSKIGLRFLEYIEEDRFNLLPPAVYLRGFLLEYARALGVDPKRMADAYMARLPR
jgi:flagellar biosynthesis protein FlhG